MGTAKKLIFSGWPRLYGFLLLLAIAGCGDKNNRQENEIILTKEELEHVEREDPAGPGSVVLTKGEVRGMKLFMRNCNRCHPAGEKGKGPSLVDKKIPDYVVHFQVRHGLGDMPAFKKEDLSKEDVQKIILFVRILRSSYADQQN